MGLLAAVEGEEGGPVLAAGVVLKCELVEHRADAITELLEPLGRDRERETRRREVGVRTGSADLGDERVERGATHVGALRQSGVDVDLPRLARRPVELL